MVPEFDPIYNVVSTVQEDIAFTITDDPETIWNVLHDLDPKVAIVEDDRNSDEGMHLVKTEIRPIFAPWQPPSAIDAGKIDSSAARQAAVNWQRSNEFPIGGNRTREAALKRWWHQFVSGATTLPEYYVYRGKWWQLTFWVDDDDGHARARWIRFSPELLDRQRKEQAEWKCGLEARWKAAEAYCATQNAKLERRRQEILRADSIGKTSTWKNIQPYLSLAAGILTCLFAWALNAADRYDKKNYGSKR